MKKQTAVDWLISQLNKTGFAEVVTDEEIQKAKEMEKEQMSEVWETSRIEDMRDIINYVGHEKTFDEYYNETFNDTDND